MRLWDLEAKKPLGVWKHPSPVTGSAFFPKDARKGVASCKDGSLWVWDLSERQAREPKPVFRGDWQVGAHLTFSPDGKKLAWTAEDGQILVRDPATGEKLQQWQVPTTGAPL